MPIIFFFLNQGDFRTYREISREHEKSAPCQGESQGGKVRDTPGYQYKFFKK